MTQFITGAPLWVWPVLALLIITGLRARQARRTPALLIYLLPLLGIMALRSVAALPADVWIWLGFATAYGLGIWIGHHLQTRWLLGREGRFVMLSGENLTLTLMMVVFWANFISGVMQAVAPLVYASGGFQLVFVAVLGLSSRCFAGRALRVWRAS